MIVCMPLESVTVYIMTVWLVDGLSNGVDHLEDCLSGGLAVVECRTVYQTGRFVSSLGI